MATAGNQIVGESDLVVYEGSGCTEFRVYCSAGIAGVNIPGLHDPGEYFNILSGQNVTFRLNHCGIRKVIIQGLTGACTVQYGIVSKSDSPGG